MTLQSAAVRRKPNAFNLVYQLRLVHDAEMFERVTWLWRAVRWLIEFKSWLKVFRKNSFLKLSLWFEFSLNSSNWIIYHFLLFQAWQDAVQFQQAYSVGAGEAKAAFHLLKEVAPTISTSLAQLVELLDFIDSEVDFDQCQVLIIMASFFQRYINFF